MNNAIDIFTCLISRELRLAMRYGIDSMMTVMFFVLIVVLFPLGISPEQVILTRISAGVIWVAALLSTMLSMDRLFQLDYEDGSLDLLILSPLPLEFLVLYKTIAHWLTTGLPLIIVSPLLGIFLHMDASGYAVLFLSLALGTPTLSMIGAIGASLILGARQSGALLSLLVLPLFLPTLIFGVSAVDSALMNLPSKPHLMVLGAILLACLALCPWASAAAIRLAGEK